jgi:hypothetical protein
MLLRPHILIALAILVASGGCMNKWAGQLTLPNQYTAVRQQLMVHSDFPLPEHHHLLESLSAQRIDLARRLGLPESDEPIHVYLFESNERFKGFMRIHYPELPDRRAFFVETDTRLCVYAQWGDRLGEDLRHEATHGYMHSVVQNLPLWLDEGLAKYSEAPLGQHGLNRVQLDLVCAMIQQGAWQPDLRRLEQIAPTRDMDLHEYAESWAWVHFLLESRPEYLELLQAHLAGLRREGSAEPISARLARANAQPEQALLEHIRSLAAASST